jgi:hypothetical protein
MKTARIPPDAAPGFGSRPDGLPARKAALAFHLKAIVFRWRRTLRDLVHGAPRALSRRPLDPGFTVVAESRSRLYPSTSPAESALQVGKVHNLRLAARALNGLLVPAGETFSFWANVGRATRRRGFVPGRELREGCVIPNIGGGLCQMTNSLYDAALRANLEIVERHAHSRPVPGSEFAGRDATVFWNYVDLRFRSHSAFQIAVDMRADELIVRFYSSAGEAAPGSIPAPSRSCETPAAESCETCGVADCFRHAAAEALPRSHGAAWMVDAYSPEIDAWMATRRSPDDHLLLPLDSLRFRVGPYRWTTSGFTSVRQSPLTVVRRSLASRRLASQGAARQRALLKMDEAMAGDLARHLPPLATHVSVSQNLLPFLWREGMLGGRTFDVLMTRLPLHELESTLDRAATAHPGSSTLADFRAPREIVQAERQALAAARGWITPHAVIAALASDRAQLLEWRLPKAEPRRPGKAVVFPASTLGRKGAYELREAARALGIPLKLHGPILESPDFWSGVSVSQVDADWLADAAAVVLPAWVENQPRRLLQALAAGVPVITTRASGLHSIPGLSIIPEGDVAALIQSLSSVLRD